MTSKLEKQTQKVFISQNKKTNTYGSIFLATDCITNKAASEVSQVVLGDCKDMNICRKQFDEPTMKTTSLISSETFMRKSGKSSPSSRSPS